MASLATGWVSQHRPGEGPICQLVCLRVSPWLTRPSPGRCHGHPVNKKAPHFNAFKWPLRALYWLPCSETWQRHPSKWHLYFNIAKLGTQGLLFEHRAVETFQGKAKLATLHPGLCWSRQHAFKWSISLADSASRVRITVSFRQAWIETGLINSWLFSLFMKGVIMYVLKTKDTTLY